MKFQLKDGLKVGLDKDAVIHKECEISKITTFMLTDARLAAERLVPTPTGYELLVSPTRVDIELLSRRIKRIGDINGPISERELKSLSEDDMVIIAKMAEQLDNAEEIPTDPRDNQESAAD
ncbi:hypothetical protein J8N54_001645 [Salmonella enterica]|nr:hypothetical protein [Salmonella enterica]EHH5781161.1 hypothetical protein [Salmonella enterica]ELE3234339.1 hypothetical protein [Salmonella enterica subsp. enterica serovar Pomona]ELZ0794986.1 hypothetical protein [Salmonella enterica]